MKKTLNRKSFLTVIGGVLFAMAMSATFEPPEPHPARGDSASLAQTQP